MKRTFWIAWCVVWTGVNVTWWINGTISPGIAASSSTVNVLCLAFWLFVYPSLRRPY